MVEICPCGCGREVGFFKQGSARAVREIDQRLAALEALRRAIDAHPVRADRQRVDDLRSREHHGQLIRARFLDHVHGEARPGITPDLVTIKRAMDTWARAADAVLDTPAAR
jgi:hypothetical protein